MTGILQDLRYAARGLAKHPGFAIVAVLTLAVAVGANTAILTIADAVLFRPLPYAAPARVLVFLMLNPSTGQRSTLVPYEYVRAMSQQHRGLSEVGMADNGPQIIVTTADGSERVSSLAVSANYFDVLGVKPARGRLFHARDVFETGRPAILSYTAWIQRFGGDPGIVGRSVQLGGSSFDVVGVLPRSFFFPTFAFLPNRPDLVTLMPPVPVGERGGTFYPIARLEPDVTREQAQAEADAIVAPLIPQARRATPVLDDVRTSIFPSGQPVMWFLLAGALFLLLIRCANLANLLLARTHRREQETAVRAALGAGRARLIQPVILEALIVGVAAAALAVLVTGATFEALARQVPSMVYRNVPVGVDVRVTAFAMGLSLLAALMFSAVPAWRSTGLDVRARIQGVDRMGSARRNRLGRPMLAVQVALAIVLVFGAVIAARAFVSILRVPLGFNPENVIAIAVPVPSGTVDRQAFYERAIESVATRGDVASAGAVGSMPFDGSAPDDGVVTRDSQEQRAGIIHVLPGYFETAGITLVRGRFLNQQDMSDGGDSAVVSEAAARALFPDGEPLGGTFGNSRGRTFLVVGVVSDIRQALDSDPRPTAYVLPGADTRRLGIVVRMRSRQNGILEDIKRQMAALAPGVPLTVGWWSDSMAAQGAYRNPRFQTIVLVTFAGVALGLTGLGVVGVVSFLVAMRTREMGIRMALGAEPGSLVAFVLRQTFAPIAAGTILGLVVTHWAKRLAETQLFKVDTNDPVMLVAAVLTVIVAAAAAAYIPARRAAQIDPVQALRAE